MEREILIANTKTQKRSKITSSAMTLGELKTDLRANGIDYSDMTFTEGISKTQLLDDATQLPQNVMYKGQPTNNLVILLTNTKKKIASGIISRKEVYELIKENDLQEDVKVEFGKNFTQVTTDNLIKFLEDNDVSLEEAAYKEEIKEENPTDEPKEVEKENYEEDDYEDNDDNYTIADLLADNRVLSIGDSIFTQVAMLANEKVLEANEINNLIEDLKGLLDLMKKEDKKKSEPVSTSDGSINDEDIDSMINDII